MIPNMKKSCIFIALCLIFSTQSLMPSKITTIFFDVESIFETDSMRASGYVGKIASLRYLSQVGHLPCQEDLFKQLKPIRATSTQITYNNNLELPLILSDWLTNQQSSNKIKEIIQKYLSSKNLSDIEVKVLLAVISMMLTPQHLADTQKTRSKMEHTLQKLKQSGYKIYLVGNWSNINVMKMHFPEIFQYVHGTFMSGEIHLLKPYIEFYQHVLSHTNTPSENALWIESESKFNARVQQYGYNGFRYNPADYHSLVSGLRQFHINI